MAEPSDPPVTETAADAAEDRVARARSRRSAVADEDDIAPKLPRGSGFKISMGHLIKIALTASLLVMLIAIQRPCANAVSSFVTSFDEGSAAKDDKAKMPKPGTVDGSGGTHYETIRGDMTEEEMRAAIERAKACAGHGSAAPARGPAGSAEGSAAGLASPAGAATPERATPGSATP